MKKITVLAVDLGAESGRVIAVHFDGNTLSLEPLHRFPNPLTRLNGTLHWDFLHLWREIKTGIRKGKRLNPASIGVDTWGVDFGLLDGQGNLLGNPVNYRDKRTVGMMEKVFAKVPREAVYAQTGIQMMSINTLYQLYSLVETQSPQLTAAKTLLLAPDLLNYWLTGTKSAEFTIATTTQMYNPTTGDWAYDMLDKLGIPSKILPPIVQPGTRLGAFEGIPVFASAGHDTASAVAAVPTTTPNFAYISSGTWSLVGLEREEPVLGADALAANVTNEGGVNQTIRLLSNVTGLWLVQQARAAWKQAGRAYDYGTLVELATLAPALTAWIDPTAAEFLAPGDHPALVRAHCERSGQPLPETDGAVVRVLLESLALQYRAVLDDLRDLTNTPQEVLHITGGGTQNRLLNQFTANATGLPVITGPIEATVAGNALVQLIALGEITDLAEGRAVVARSADTETYLPQDEAQWTAAFGRFKQLL